MAKRGWLDRFINKARDAGMPDEDIERMRSEGGDAIPPNAWEEGGEGDQSGQHFHVHLNSPNGGDTRTHDDPDLNNEGGGDMVSREEYDALCLRLDELEQQLAALAGNDEEDVELEDMDTQDRRKFKLRRGDKIKVRDEEPPVPEREPEIMGETDLPGIEDLNKTTDSIRLEPLWQATIAAAEVIVPGYRVPTFDAAHRPTLTAKRLCALRRGVLTEASKDAATGDVVRRFTGDANLARLPCEAVKVAFTATADAIRGANGTVLRASATATTDAPTVPSLAKMNQNASEFWKGQGNGATRR